METIACSFSPGGGWQGRLACTTKPVLRPQELRLLLQLWLLGHSQLFSWERNLYLLLLCFWNKDWMHRDICKWTWKNGWVSGTVPEEFYKQKEKVFEDPSLCIHTSLVAVTSVSSQTEPLSSFFQGKSGKSPLEPTCSARLFCGCCSLSLFFSCLPARCCDRLSRMKKSSWSESSLL